MTSSFFEAVERHWRRVVVGVMLGGALATTGSFVLPKQYSSTMRLLVVQSQTAGLDPYTAVKSTEQIASNVRELMYTSLVANRVLASTISFDAGYFSQDEYRRRQEWRRSIDVGVTPGTGIVTITAYHPQRAQAEVLVQGVAQEVMTQTPNYGLNAQARVIDTPLPSRWFARPNVLQNAFYGAVIGGFLALISLIFEQLTTRPKRFS